MFLFKKNIFCFLEIFCFSEIVFSFFLFQCFRKCGVFFKKRVVFVSVDFRNILVFLFVWIWLCGVDPVWSCELRFPGQEPISRWLPQWHETVRTDLRIRTSCLVTSARQTTEEQTEDWIKAKRKNSRRMDIWTIFVYVLLLQIKIIIWIYG